MKRSIPAIDSVFERMTILFGLGICGFLIIGLTLSFYRAVLFEETLVKLEHENSNIANDIAQGYKDIEYFNSSQFKDKFAKENLGKIHPGEKVLLFNGPLFALAFGSGANAILAEQREAKYLELLRQMPVIEHWRLYLFHRSTLEELKDGVLKDSSTPLVQL